MSSNFVRYRADFTNLVAGERYTFRVFQAGQEISASGSAFRTESGGPFRFVAFGDSGMGTPEQRRLATRMNAEPADIVLPLGDLGYPAATYAVLEAYYLNMYGPLAARAPFFATAGNHDYYFKEAEAYLDSHIAPSGEVAEQHAGRYYSYDWGPVHFVVLDSNTPLEHAAGEDKRMLEWLERDLSQTRKFWRVAYFHHPPYASGTHEFSIEGERVRRHVVPILERWGVQLVLCGHEHSYQRTKALRNGEAVEDGNGTVYVISGGGGAPLYQFGPRPLIAAGKADFNYLAGDVDRGRIRIRVVTFEGQPDIDTFIVAPRPQLRGQVVNSASLSTELAVGGLISIYGRNLSFEEVRNPDPAPAGESRGTTVTWQGRAARLLYASPDQVNCVLPMEGTGEGELVVTTPNGSLRLNLNVREVAPAIFVDANGPFVFDAGGQRISAANPVEAGEDLDVYVTGLGTRSNSVLGLFEQRTLATTETAASGTPGVHRVRIKTPARIAGASLRLKLEVAGVASNEVVLPVSVISA